MVTSSRRCGFGLWSAGLEGPIVADQSPQHIQVPAGQGEYRLFVSLALTPFPLVEGFRGRTATGDGVRG